MLNLSPLTGFEAFKKCIERITPDGGTIWLKVGHNRFLTAETTSSGHFPIHWTKLEKKDDPLSRVKSKQCHDAYTAISRFCSNNDGGAFFIQGKPTDYPLSKFCLESNDVVAEMDDGTTDEQWERINHFINASGLVPDLVISSGGKSLHPHWRLDKDYPTAQVVNLKRLIVIALISDPVTVSPHQPIRIAGFDRKEKNSHQTLLAHSDCKYTYSGFIEGFKRYFEFLGWKFPETITDDWWRDKLRPIVTTTNKVSREEKLEQLKQVLAIGLEGYQSEKEKQAKERELKRQKRQLTGITGQTDLVSLIEDASEKLGSDAFDWGGHNWKWSGSKARGCCPFHESKSGTSAWIAPSQKHSGQWGFACYQCTDNRQITPFTYWWYLKHGLNASYPTGKDFIEASKTFLSENGVTVPDQKWESYNQPDQAFFDFLREQEQIERAIASEGNYSDLITQLEKLPTEQSAYPKGRIHLGTPRTWETWDGREISGNALEIPKIINIAHLTTQALSQDISIILRTDEAGTGKTYDSLYNVVIPEYIPDEDEDEGKENDEPKSGKAYILTTRNPYNFPIKLPENIGIRPSRHSEIIREDGTIIPSNCVHTDLIGKMREKNLGGAGWACNGCVYRKECETKEGAESDLPCGYLYENKLERNKDALLCQVDSFLGEIEGGIDTQNTGIIADEFEEMISHLKTTKLISKTEAEATFWKFREQEVLLPLFEKLAELINRASSQKERYFKLETDEIIGELKEVLTDEMIDHLNEVYFDIETLLKEYGLFEQDLSWENFVNAEDWDVDQPCLDEINSELRSINAKLRWRDKRSLEEIIELENRKNQLEIEKAKINAKREKLKKKALEESKHYQKNRLSEQREKIFEIINNSPPNWIYSFILKVATFIKNVEDGQQPKLIIEIDKRGTILIEYPRQNLINTLKNVRYLQALSATLDPQEMASALGINEDKILQVRRPLRDKSNKTTNIYSIAPNSNQWTDNDRKRMKSALEKLNPDGENIPIFAPKKSVKHLGVNRWYGCHDVGSNLDQGQTRTISIGELFIDRGALERQYKLLGGDPEQFENYYLYKMQNRIYQRHERDRSHRYPEQEFVTDIIAPSKMDYSFLREWGYQPIIHPANALGEEVIPSKQRKKHSIFIAIENRIRQGLKITQTIIGKICDCSQAWISMVASRYGGWKRLVNAMRLLIEDEKANGKLTKNALDSFKPDHQPYYQQYAQERASFLENAVKDIKFLDQEKITQIVSIILSIYSRKDNLWGVVISLLSKEVKDKLITVFFSLLPTIKPYTVYDTA